MRLLKENYEGLEQVDTLSEELKTFLLKPDIQELFKKNEFGTLYRKFPPDFVSDFTQLMASLDIDPLNYLEYIPKSFLAFTSIEHLDIPKHITRISDYAFRNCHELTDIIIPNQVKRIGNWAFSNCQKLTSITIPNSVTSIGNYAFYNCTGLTSLTIGNKVKSIGNWAFYGCSGLKSITIPDKVTSIEKAVFFDCAGLTNVTIPNSVTSIGNYAFDSCISLNYINYKGTKDQWGKITLMNEWDDSSSIKAIQCTDGDIEL